MPGTMIRVKELRKRYGRSGPVALSGVSLEVERGEAFGLLGNEGAGKTTLLRILAALTSPTSGEAYVDGFDVTSQRQRIRETVGFLPQVPAMVPGASLERYLEFWGRVNGFPKPRARERGKELIQALDLAADRSAPLLDGTTSVQKRAFLAMALLADPPVLLLDEPTAGLAPAESGALVAHLEELRDRGKTLLVASARLLDLQVLCRRIVTMSEGWATRAYATPELLKHVGDARHARAFVETDAPPSQAVAALQRLPGVLEVREGKPAHIVFVEPGTFRREEARQALEQEGVPVKAIREADVTISDVFRTLSRRGAT